MTTMTEWGAGWLVAGRDGGFYYVVYVEGDWWVRVVAPHGHAVYFG